AQVSGVSYGIPLQPAVTTLIASGATARVLVPQDDSLGGDWTTIGFNDSGWSSKQTGVGFETDGRTPFVPVTIANTVTDFAGEQGVNRWYYGYWDKKNDADGVYAQTEFVRFPNSGEGFAADDFWTGSAWDWFNGDPPFTQLTSQGGWPSGDNGDPALPTHWAVRRYFCESNGPITISGTLTHTSDWVYVTQSGVVSNSLFYIYLLGAGEGYLDDMKVVAGSVPEAGANLLANGDFEGATLSPWTVSANLAGSAITASVKHGGASSLHIVSTAAGTTQTSAIWQNISPALLNGQIYTLSYWYLASPNSAPLEVRTSGRFLDTTPT